MSFKNAVYRNRSKFPVLALVVFLLTFINGSNSFRSSYSEDTSYDAQIIRLSHHRAQKQLDDEELVKDSKTSVNNKWVSSRKKYKRLIEVNDDHEVYAKRIQYSSFVDPHQLIRYEAPYFVSEQHSFLFRLTVF